MKLSNGSIRRSDNPHTQQAPEPGCFDNGGPRARALAGSLGCLGLAAALLLTTPGCDRASTQLSAQRDGQMCRQQLEQVYDAIQAYRQDHKDIPEWLSDLVPKYLPSTNLLICPITKKTGRVHNFAHLRDPRVMTGYLYEFSPLPMGGIYGGGQIRMRDFKRRQMGFLGGDVAMVRCHLHQPVLNLAFSGRIYESALGWEDNFTNVVDVSTWRVEKLFPEFARATSQPALAPTQQPKVELLGKAAPGFTLPVLEGDDFNLAAHQGKDIVLLDFWASWCGPCRVAMPIQVEVAREYAGKGVRYFAVNLREQPDTIRRYLKDARLDLDVVVPLDKDGSVAQKYGVRAIPTMVLVDKQGVVRNVHVGSSANLKADLTRALDEILADRRSTKPQESQPQPATPDPGQPASLTTDGK